MEDIAIKSIRNLDAEVRMPGSKSYTQRALVAASLADGTSFLKNALISADTEYLMEALRSLGAQILAREGDIIVHGTGGNILNPGKEIFLGNNGTALRFLITLAALGQGEYVLTGDARLCERPVKPLLDVLSAMGVSVRSRDGFPPVVIRAAGLPGGTASLHDIESSQYVSSLFLSAPYAAKDTTLELRGRTPSLPYVEMTLETMQKFGIAVAKEASNRYTVRSGKSYQGTKYLIEGDVSSASYFFLAAALTGDMRERH